MKKKKARVRGEKKKMNLAGGVLIKQAWARKSKQDTEKEIMM